MDNTMSSIIRKSYVLKKQFIGLPTEDDFEVVESTLPPISDGEFLVECLYLSVDPYMRPYSRNLKDGSIMIGAGVGRVVQSKNDNFPIDSIVVGPCGWSTLVIADRTKIDSKLYRKMPSDLEISHTIGILGLTGLTAYFGFLDVCTPKAGETVFVNTAAGAVGNVVGQIAKIKGCTVVGCAGSEEKLNYLREIGFDGVFNYKTANLDKVLTELCPKGIDCFFDNVGGAMFDTVLKHMNRHGRISLCGAISMYNVNDQTAVKGPYIHIQAIGKELKFQGFLAPSFYARYEEGLNQLNKWVREGKIIVREQVVEGFENMPKAFIGLFSGDNIGKVVVKIK